jgi:hypothetical protein
MPFSLQSRKSPPETDEHAWTWIVYPETNPETDKNACRDKPMVAASSLTFRFIIRYHIQTLCIDVDILFKEFRLK